MARHTGARCYASELRLQIPLPRGYARQFWVERLKIIHPGQRRGVILLIDASAFRLIHHSGIKVRDLFLRRFLFEVFKYNIGVFKQLAGGRGVR